MSRPVAAPSVCPTCGGDDFIEYTDGRRIAIERGCPDCRCVICGARTDVIGGECGHCHDRADAAYERRCDR